MNKKAITIIVATLFILAGILMMLHNAGLF